MGWVMMSERELNRVEVLSQVVDRRMTAREAASVLGLSVRQMQRLLVRFAALASQSMREVSDKLNATPRKCLGYRTASEAFVEELRKINDYGVSQPDLNLHHKAEVSYPCKAGMSSYPSR